MFNFRFSTTLSCSLILFGIVFQSSVVHAVWEHAPITETTRLTKQASQPWEFGMVFHDSSLYPAEFYSPGGAKVVLHVLNLSDVPLTITRANPKRIYRILPGTYKTIHFGKLNFGDHLFFVDVFSGHTMDAETGTPVETADRLKCSIHAKRWPGPIRAYPSAWIIKNNQLLPKRISLPAGRKTDVFVGSLGKPVVSEFKLFDHTFKLKPNAVTLTEIRSLTNQEIKIQHPFDKTTTFIVH
jgi:hypothetical protein